MGLAIHVILLNINTLLLYFDFDKGSTFVGITEEQKDKRVNQFCSFVFLSKILIYLIHICQGVKYQNVKMIKQLPFLCRKSA